MNLLLTRAFHKSIDTRKKIESLGHRVIWSPMLEIEKIKYVVPKKHYDGILISSFHALSALRRVGQRQATIIATGEATACAVKNMGFANVLSANGNSYDMAQLAKNHFGKNSSLLYMCARNAAFDMGKFFQQKKIACETLVVYQANEAAGFTPQAQKCFMAGEIGGVLLYSSRAAACFVKLFVPLQEQHGLKIPLFYALSANIGGVLPSLWQKNCKCASLPNQDSLINLL